jgi:hypothetical protein
MSELQILSNSLSHFINLEHMSVYFNYLPLNVYIIHVNIVQGYLVSLFIT